MSKGAGEAFHVGIIMDGNGRWAMANGLKRLAGHAHGAKRVTDIVRACPELGITHLTLFAFSTENWRRPLDEIEELMRIFRHYIDSRTARLRAENVRVRFIGRRDRISEELHDLMKRMEAATRACTGLTLTIAIDYGARDELARAAREMALTLRAGTQPDRVDYAALGDWLDTRGLPDPDFVIRTSGERRVSNFQLWQSVYAEYSFPAIAWPDFTVAHFRAELDRFAGRERRFGQTTAYAKTASAVPEG